MSVASARWRRAGWIAIVATLGVACVAQFFHTDAPSVVASKSGQLEKMLPGSGDGWQATDEPLGPTESLRTATAQILNYDDFVNRRYRSNGREFSVYVAHWARGRMPTRLVALHTPDRCWIENGWKCTQSAFNITALPGRGLPPAQERWFIPPNGSDRIYVWFWLTTDGIPYDFGNRTNSVPSPLRYLWQIARENFEVDGEQVFVRVNSPQPLASFANDPGFERVMLTVKALLDSARRVSSL